MIGNTYVKNTRATDGLAVSILSHELAGSKISSRTLNMAAECSSLPTDRQSNRETQVATLPPTRRFFFSSRWVKCLSSWPVTVNLGIWDKLTRVVIFLLFIAGLLGV